MSTDRHSECCSSLYSILLAGGASTRYGSPKQLVRVTGDTMLRAAIENVSGVNANRLIVVIGAYASELHDALRDFRGILVMNPSWREGIASSIRAGLTRVPVTCTGVMIVLADQPFVTSEDLDNLVRTWQRSPHAMAAAAYNGTLGAPAIFPRRSFQDLAKLSGDAGARHLLSRDAARVLRVAMPNAEIDIDRPEDLVPLKCAM